MSRSASERETCSRKTTHGLVEKQGLEQECTCQEGSESREAGATSGWRTPEDETGLVCMIMEVEYGRVSGTLWRSISGQ